MPLTWYSSDESGRRMEGFHQRVDEYYELVNLYDSAVPSDYALRNFGRVMVKEGADIEQVGVPKTPCHGSASSSQEEEQRLISMERHNIFARQRSVEEDPTLKSKLRGFYCVTVLFCVYTSAYFTYLIMTQR